MRIETVCFSWVDPLRAAYRTDGIGVVAPATARRPYVDTIWFVCGEQGMPCGANSRSFFIKATGTGYKTVGETRIELTSGDFTLINNTWMPTPYEGRADSIERRHTARRIGRGLTGQGAAFSPANPS